MFTSALMAQPRSSSRLVWFILDELPSLYKLPSLQSALAEARQYGACYLIGIQLVSQLKELYGNDGADSIIGLTRNKLIFNPGDPKTAAYMAEFIGKNEIFRRDHGISIGATSLRDGQSVSTRLVQELIILPEELAQLEALHGVLCFTGNFPVCHIKIDYLSLDGVEDGFMEDPKAILRADMVFAGGVIPKSYESAPDEPTQETADNKPENADTPETISEDTDTTADIVHEDDDTEGEPMFEFDDMPVPVAMTTGTADQGGGGQRE